MRRQYLKEHRPILFSNLNLSGALYRHLAEIGLACTDRTEPKRLENDHGNNHHQRKINVLKLDTECFAWYSYIIRNILFYLEALMKKDESKKIVIADYINAFFYEYDKVPSVRDIVEGTGIPLSTVHRYLVDMQEKGELSYKGFRSARTKEMSEVSPIHGIAVWGTVACGPGQEEEQRFIETIRMPESLVEKGDYFALIAKGESMIGAGIFPGDYVFVKRQQTANEGDLVIALFDGKNNLKKLGFDPNNKKYILHSCNPDTKTYSDIIVDELQIQGVVKGSYHKY